MEDHITRRYRARREAREKRHRETRNTPIRVSEDDPTRSWKPHDVCPEHAMNIVLEILLERQLVVQSELSDEVAVRLEVKLGTGRAYVSGALLYFREAGWVECVDSRAKSPEWRVVD